MDSTNAIAGTLLGTAVGDALGLAYEGLSRERAKRLFPGPIQYRFLFGRGMVSDDTEHTLMVLRSLREEPDDADAFQRRFAKRLRLWILGLPAGAGFATLRACLKLLIGFSPNRSGVYSAGNGPAMRSAVIGAFFRGDAERRIVYTHAASVITHTDEWAIVGAQLVSLAAAIEPENYLEVARAGLDDEDWSALFDKIEAGLSEGISPEEFAERIGAPHGVSGFVMQSVPAALFIWLRNPRDFRQCVQDAIRLGGDTDTVAAIVGGICGAHVGTAGIPREWLEGIHEWPMGVDRMQRLACGEQIRPSAAVHLVRNAVFLSAVLAHGFRRLLPPY